MIGRRSFLGAMAGLALGLSAPAPAAARVLGTPDPSRIGSRLDALAGVIVPELDMDNAHTGERVRLRFHHPEGYDPRALERLNWFLRDWREGESRPMDLRLFWAIAALRQGAMADGHDGRVRVLSAYRTRRTNDLLRARGYGAARNSFHLRARAIDLVLPGVPVAGISAYARWLQVGGVGHYPGSFVHIDSGDLRSWHG